MQHQGKEKKRAGRRKRDEEKEKTREEKKKQGRGIVGITSKIGLKSELNLLF